MNNSKQLAAAGAQTPGVNTLLKPSLSGNEKLQIDIQIEAIYSVSDYTRLLIESGLIYEDHSPYLQVGQFSVRQGWILHLSVVHTQYEQLLRKVLPVLSNFQTSLVFRVLKTWDTVKQVNRGTYGRQNIGKAIIIFIQDNEVIVPLLNRLMPFIDAFTGPSISSAIEIRGILSYRYGAFDPYILNDNFGNRVRCIKDHSGNLLRDEYGPPIALPAWLSDPFQSFVRPVILSVGEHSFRKRYRPVNQVKVDPKGDVLRAVRFTKLHWRVWCILKQGRIGIFSDEVGADARHRLQWQFQLSKELKGIVRIPTMYDILVEREQVWVAMKLIRGNGISKLSFDLLRNRPWFDLTKPEQMKIVRLLLEIVHQIKALHQAGYWHRDITSNNFLIDRFGRAYLIDLELTYNYKTKMPEVPFGKGTPGYMSPQQRENAAPTPEDDYYAFGALMIACMTGIEPAILLRGTVTNVESKLQFYFGNSPLLKLAAACLADDPKNRPDLKKIEEDLSHYTKDTRVYPAPLKQARASAGMLRDLIVKMLQALGDETCTINGLWYSYQVNPYDKDIYPLNDKAIRWSLYRGVGGILYTLIAAKNCGYDLSATEQNIKSAWGFIRENAWLNCKDLAPGLYHGMTGMAVLIVKALDSEMLPKIDYLTEMIQLCCTKESIDIDLINGLAGDGIGIMQCSHYLPSSFYLSKLNQIVSSLLQLQQRDGSWIKLNVEQMSEKHTGFGYGIAGILYFLLVYNEQYDSPDVAKAITRGLNYLEDSAIHYKGYYDWHKSNINKSKGGWWCEGGPGIALTFLKAFEITGNEKYRQIAEKALNRHDKRLVTHQLSQCHGAAGLGEIYLEAFRLTKNEEWLERAGWIVDLLVNLKVTDETSENYWITEQSHFPTADFMIGDSGILHFFVRWLNREKIKFPVI